jgi:hypothetical protein
MGPTPFLLGVVLLFLVTTHPALGANEAVKIHVTPGTGFAPLAVVIRTTLDPHVDNRQLCVIWSNHTTAEYGKSCELVEGDRAPRTFFSRRALLSAGEYTVTASILRSDGIARSSVSRLHVLEGLPQ